MFGTVLVVVMGVCVALQSSPVVSAPASQGALMQDWPERYLNRELAVELYGILQNYLVETGGLIRPGSKRNSELINSLLGLPKSLTDVGRR